MRICLFLISLIFLHQTVYAQHTIINDTTGITARRFSSDHVEKYRSDRDFMYDRIREPPRSIWDRFWTWFWGKLGEILTSKNGKRMLNSVVVLLAIAILVFFILKISGMTIIGLFGKKNKSDRLSHSLLNENIHAIQFDIAIQQAIEAGQFRLAVRLLYLQLLKNLADRQLISWRINKTNVAYVHELSGKACQQPFSELTYQFENNWYGDRPIDAAEFKKVRYQFDLLNRQLQTL